MDADGSGWIAFAELHAYCPAAIPPSRRHTLRGHRSGHSELDDLVGQSSLADVSGTLRAALAARHAKLVDLFREWDVDSDGRITRREFRQALLLLGLNASRAELDVTRAQSQLVALEALKTPPASASVSARKSAAAPSAAPSAAPAAASPPPGTLSAREPVILSARGPAPPIDAMPGLLPGYVDALRERISGYILSLACCGAGRKEAVGAAPGVAGGDAAAGEAACMLGGGVEAASSPDQQHRAAPVERAAA